MKTPLRLNSISSVSAMVCLSVLITVGCGAGGVAPDTASTVRKEPIEDIDPFSIGDEFAMVGEPQTQAPPAGTPQVPENKRPSKRTPEVLQEQQDNSRTPAEPTPSPEISAEEMGFRIHIGIFDKESDAKEFAKNTESKIDENVYIVYEAPFFKVRVGDFTSLNDAEEYVKHLKSIGFKTAWWIRTTINTR